MAKLLQLLMVTVMVLAMARPLLLVMARVTVRKPVKAIALRVATAKATMAALQKVIVRKLATAMMLLQKLVMVKPMVAKMPRKATAKIMSEKEEMVCSVEWAVQHYVLVGA
jgi:hypothetical protein